MIGLMKQTHALLEVQNFIKDSEVIYESLSTNESDVKTEAALTALGDNNAKHPNVININIIIWNFFCVQVIYVIIKIMIPCFNRPSLLSRFLVG